MSFFKRYVMKKLSLLILNLLVMGWYMDVSAQKSNEEAIVRGLEQAEVQAVLNGDTLTLFNKLWAPEFIVNNPANLVVNKNDVVTLIRTGKIDYEHFARVIEKVSIIDNTAIVMGREELKPKGVTDHAGKLLTRRFTNIWMKRNGRWKVVARQATIVGVN
jgi:hypothetical protein